MTDRDEEIARLYRTLAKEEPPEALDAAILAAARREANRPSLGRRWAVPVSVAAVFVLAIGLTLEIRDESPGVEAPTAAPPVRPDATESATVRDEKTAPSLREEKRSAPPATTREREPKPAREGPRFVPPPPPATSNIAPTPVQAMPRAPAASGAAPSAEKRIAVPAAAPRSAASDLAVQSARARTDDPAAALEAIAKLRAAGRDAQADRALEDFRRRFPDYRMDDAMWARVKPR